MSRLAGGAASAGSAIPTQQTAIAAMLEEGRRVGHIRSMRGSSA